MPIPTNDSCVKVNMGIARTKCIQTHRPTWVHGVVWELGDCGRRYQAMESPQPTADRPIGGKGVAVRQFWYTLESKHKVR
jgi:hypothetical protein